MGHAQRSEGTRTLGVHAPLGDDLAGEVGKLLDKPQILQEQRAAWTGGQMFWLSGTGAPAAVVNGSVFSSNAIVFSLVVGSGVARA